ncbi:MAG: 2,3,4,5-tetrahydropyridine-2,6-dicarboxylate N-succinyltransferase, partial [Flavobacteriaceae bacterium]
MQSIIESAWENRSLLEKSETQEAIREVIRQLDTGKLRVAS